MGNERRGGAKRILILEDTISLLRLYSKVLLNAGYEVHLAATLGDAREFLDMHHFDVFICDIVVGEDLGTELLFEKRELLSENGTQVVVVSGEPQYRALCDEMNLEFFMQKPIAMKSLVTLVGRLVDMRDEPIAG